MMKHFYYKFCLLVALFSASLSLLAQTKSDKTQVVWDTQLDTLIVTERLINHNKETNIGAKLTYIEPEVVRLYQSKTLAELLADNSAVHIKSMGLGALSTASFRGSSASQTKVNWNGIDITPVMAGIFDFSQMPVFFADGVALSYGNSDQKFGSGAIGGSIDILTFPNFLHKNSWRVSGEYGSYNTYSGSVGGDYRLGDFSFKTKLFYQHSDNNYSYINKVTSNEHFLEKRKDAQFYLLSGMQEAFYRIDDESNVSLAFWYQQGERMLPPPLGVEATAHEQQSEKNIRAYIGYDRYMDGSKLRMKLAVIHYGMQYKKWFDSDYFKPSGNINRSNTYHFSSDYEHSFLEHLNYGATLTYRHDVANAESYRTRYSKDDPTKALPNDREIPPLRHRDNLSFHQSLRWLPFDWFGTDTRVMLQAVDWSTPVLTYSFGFNIAPIPSEKLYLKGSFAYNYRYPSLNELYWVPGGNPDVRPEHGTSVDLTAQYSKDLGHYWSIDLNVSGYRMLIDDWILWLPTDEITKGVGSTSMSQWLWSPKNNRNVLTSGVDARIGVAFRKDSFQSKVEFNYAYTDSHTYRRTHQDDHSYLKQIPYVPKQKWNIRWTNYYKNIYLNLQTSYVGVRYITTDQTYFTYPYNVTNLQVGYTLRFNDITIAPQIRVDNLFNTYYESTQYYPMPRRNILGSIAFTL